jgi:hypothetical protein
VREGIQKALSLQGKLAKTQDDLEGVKKQLEALVDNHSRIHTKSKERPTTSGPPSAW